MKLQHILLLSTVLTALQSLSDTSSDALAKPNPRTVTREDRHIKRQNKKIEKTKEQHLKNFNTFDNDPSLFKALMTTARNNPQRSLAIVGGAVILVSYKTGHLRYIQPLLGAMKSGGAAGAGAGAGANASGGARDNSTMITVSVPEHQVMSVHVGPHPLSAPAPAAGGAPAGGAAPAPAGGAAPAPAAGGAAPAPAAGGR